MEKECKCSNVTHVTSFSSKRTSPSNKSNNLRNKKIPIVQTSIKQIQISLNDAKNATLIHHTFIFLKGRNLHSAINFISKQRGYRATVKKDKY